jgi:hypothetical protein
MYYDEERDEWVFETPEDFPSLDTAKCLPVKG